MSFQMGINCDGIPTVLPTNHVHRFALYQNKQIQILLSKDLKLSFHQAHDECVSVRGAVKSTNKAFLAGL